MASSERSRSASAGALTEWYRRVVGPRIEILRLLPTAGARLVSLVTMMEVILGMLPVFFIVATGAVIGRVPEAVGAGIGSTASREMVQLFMLAAGAFLLQQLLTPLRLVLGERMKRRVDGYLRDRLAEIVSSSAGVGAVEDPETMNASSEVTRLFETAWTTPGMACSGLLALVSRYLRLIGLLGIVAVVSSWVAALALGGATMLFRYGQRGGLRKYSVVWRDVAGINRRGAYLRELAMGSQAAKELRIFGLTDWLSERYAEAYLSAYNAVSASRRAIYLKPYLVYTPIGLAVAAWVTVGMARGAASGAIPLGELVVGLQAISMSLLLGAFYPEADVATQFGMQAVAALKEVRERIGRAPTNAPSGPAPQRRSPLPSAVPERSIRFENVSFRYPGSTRLLLDRFDLELPAGKCTAIVGVNGAGKTTLVKLLTRLYEPTDGAIRADGFDIGLFEPDAWRRQLSVIFQDFIRYELSAADNIAFGAVHAPLDTSRLERAAREAGIFDVLAAQPLALQTPLARTYTNGTDLSGGQWQRVAIARSLYALDAGARLLILDEPTSALDVRAEVAFFDRFVELTRGVTSVLISHRFSSVRRADRIVVIDGGRIIEQGSHAELMALDGYYAQLFRLQAERFAAGMDAEGNRVDPMPINQPYSNSSEGLAS